MENYARGQHLTNIRHYIDDDESGRFFDRSAYSRMMDDVENGKIGVCIMKDLTRWGRDYLQVGNAMEIFRRNNVRFIAVNNGIDSEKPDTLEFAPFINIMSEWYAKDISKKVKTGIAVYLVSHTFDIAIAVFDIGQSVVDSSSGIIRDNTAIDISSLTMQMQAAMATMEIGELVTLALETLVVSWCLKILSVVITVIMYGRMIEIYLYTSLAPIPFATMSNREWGHVGTNYFRGLFALAFQAFLMMVCVAIYAALIGSIRVSSDIHSALFGTMAYTVILCFSLLKTGSLSKQIFGSH